MKGRFIRILLVVIVIMAAYSYFAGEPAGPEIAPGSTLELSIGGEYVEAPSPPILARVFGDGAKPFASLLSTFAMAERDDRLDAVVLRIRGLQIGWGKAQELRDAIGDVRAAGRKVIAVLEVGSLSATKEYYVASSADEVYFLPGASVPVVGLAAEYMYFGGLWEKLGVRFDVARVGRYKSAVEVLAGTEMSDAAREMADSLLDSTMALFLAGIAEGRGLSVEAVAAAIDEGPVLPDHFERLGLIDGTRHLSDLPEMQVTVVRGADYARVDPVSVGFVPEARFALVYGSGNVVSGDGSITRRGGPVFASETVGRALKDAAADPEIAAIIFRIDSPGGSSLAAESVWDAVEQAKTKGKPIIASFSDLAASGGYYAAAGADGIVSGAGTLTGSIGVFALRPILGGALEKLDINVASLTRGEHADFLLSTQALSPGARDRLQSAVDQIYDLFVARVAAGRSMEIPAVDAVAQGRVWTGEQALAQGLVDEIGGLRAAVRRAKSVLGMAADADVALVPYPEPGNLADQLMEAFNGQLAERLRARAMRSFVAELPAPAVLVELADWLAQHPADTPLLVPPMLIEIR